MAIIVSKDGRGARRIEPTPIEQEDYLQEYIHQNPEAIPVTELKQGMKLLILAREFPTDSGPIDALGVDSDGDIYIIETKLYRNPDKRLVIAQMLDYGAALWKGYQDFSDFTAQVEASGGSRLKAGLTRSLAEFFTLDEQALEPVLQNMRQSIAGGRFQFVVLMDHLEDRLRTLISFVNSNSNFRVLGCELEFYQHDGFEVLIPRLYGAEVRSSVSSGSPRSNLTLEAAQHIADSKGVGNLFRHTIAELPPFFSRRSSAKTAITFAGRIPSEDQIGTIFSVVPEQSSSTSGLAYAVYLTRFAEYFSIPDQDVHLTLPGFEGDIRDSQWEDMAYRGFLKNQEDADRMISRLRVTRDRST